MKKSQTRKIISFQIYLLNLLLLLTLIICKGVDKSFISQIQTGLLIVYIIITFFHLLCIYTDKTNKVSLFNIFVIVLYVAFYKQETYFIQVIYQQEVINSIPFIVLGLTVVEYVACRFRNWKKWIHKKFKSNIKRKQNNLFYRIIWKNFKKNWKDYLLIVVCSILIFAVAIITFSMKEILNGNYGIKKIQIFNGLTEILLNAMIPMSILAVFLIVILVFYYLKTRARNYGIFLTLGMHRRTLYYVTALEFNVVFLIAVSIGGIIGRILLGMIVYGLQKEFELGMTIQQVGIHPYLYSIASIIGITGISFMAARDIFYDFNVGKSEDMRGIAEKMPGKGKYAFLAMGCILSLYSIFQYGKLSNYENEYLLLVFFVGIYLVVRNGIAIWLIRERLNKNYLKKILIHNNLFHKSQTNAGFITVLTIIQFCILFYFSFQLVGTIIAEETETMFPYDYICFADERDNETLYEIKEKYDVEMYEFPMVRVSAYDSTEKLENEFKASQKPIQGQHIGISENTYHELKKLVNPLYEKKDLGLANQQKAIYVVYQQDKSVKAQPTAFYSPRTKPLLHIGRPCKSLNSFRMHGKYENGYYYYDIVGEEISSLTGIFHQGIRENIIVFSDEYFNNAQDMWKTTNIYTGEYIADEEMRIPNVTITEGVTKLVLINVNQEDDRNILKDLDMMNDKHLDEENEIYKTITPFGNYANGVYDSSVSYLYKKEEAIMSVQTERVMKGIMSISAITLFAFMNLLIIIVKMLSEYQMDKKRIEFLNCMGMLKCDRLKLLRNEIMYYYCILPIVLSIISSIIFTAQVFHARMYTLTDIKNYLSVYCIFAGNYTIFYIFIVIIISGIYSRKVEKEAAL